jgi:hypothetical protein
MIEAVVFDLDGVIPHPRYPPEPAALHAARLVLTGLAELTVQAVAEL